MKLLVLKDSQAVAQAAAEHILSFIHSKPGLNIGLATGKTQEGVYKALIERHRSIKLRIEAARFFMLDEYLGVDAMSSVAFQGQLRSSFLSKVGASLEALEVLDGNAQDRTWESERFERQIQEAGGIDLQLLGIGANGHIGFNEPGSDFESRTRVVELHAETIQANFHQNEPPFKLPKRAISQGLGTIMESHSILLLATGDSKARAIAEMISGPITEQLPASILQLHKNVSVIVDEAAASLLSEDRHKSSR